MEEQKKIRESKFELMRIVIILMIIVEHYLNGGMGGALENISRENSNFFIMNIIESFCISSVNCFIIITGFYMIEKKKVNIYKIIKLILIMILINIVSYYVSIIFGEEKLSIKGIAKSFLPILFDVNWFVIIYSILYLMIPFLNKMIRKIDKNSYRVLLGVCVFFFYIWPTFLNNITIKDNGYGIINFIVLYLIGGYINLYKKKQKSRWYLIAYVLLSFLIWIYHEIAPNTGWAYNTIFCLLSSICLFQFFGNIKLKNNIVVNKIASTIFAIYIFHVNPFLTNLLWKKLLHCQNFYNSPWFVCHLLLASIVILILGILVGMLINKLFDTYIDKKMRKIKLLNYNISVEKE